MLMLFSSPIFCVLCALHLQIHSSILFVLRASFLCRPRWLAVLRNALADQDAAAASAASHSCAMRVRRWLHSGLCVCAKLIELTLNP